jgi:F-type H+-transporting ATPase subunit epsilon
MADKIKFELVSPERLLMSVDADMVVVPGADGDFGAMPGHAPLISTIRPGLIVVSKGDNAAPERFFVRGGFAEVTPEAVTVLAEEAVAVADMDMAKLDKDLANLQEDIRDAKDEDSRSKAQTDYERLKQVRDAVAA